MYTFCCVSEIISEGVHVNAQEAHTHNIWLSDLVQRTSSLWFTGPLILYMSDWTIYSVGCGRQVYVPMWLRTKVNSPTILPHTLSVHRTSLRYYAHWVSLRYPDTLSLTVVFFYTEPPCGVQTHLASLRYSFIPSLFAVSRHTKSHRSIRVHWASLRYPDTLNLAAAFVYTEPRYGIRLHRASLQYPDTLSLTALFVYTEPHYGIQKHWVLLHYSWTLSLTTVFIFTELQCSIQTHWASLRYPDTLSLTAVFVYTEHYYGIMHTEPCCGSRAYSLATVLWILSLTAVFVYAEPHYGIQTHWLSLRNTQSITTVLCTPSLAVVFVYTASLRYSCTLSLTTVSRLTDYHYGI